MKAVGSVNEKGQRPVLADRALARDRSLARWWSGLTRLIADQAQKEKSLLPSVRIGHEPPTVTLNCSTVNRLRSRAFRGPIGTSPCQRVARLPGGAWIRQGRTGTPDTNSAIVACLARTFGRFIQIHPLRIAHCGLYSGVTRTEGLFVVVYSNKKSHLRFNASGPKCFFLSSRMRRKEARGRKSGEAHSDTTLP
jgi:hypothetical protein